MTYVQKYIIGMGLENINLVYLQDIKNKENAFKFWEKIKKLRKYEYITHLLI